MAHITKHLTTVSAASRTAPPRRRAVALLLCALLCLSALSPGLVAAGEADSEGEGAAIPAEALSPDFDPGGEESVLEEAPAATEEGLTEEGEAVEEEPANDPAAVAPDDVSAAGTEPEAVVPTEDPSAVPPVTEVPPVSYEPQPAPQQAETPAVEPVRNQELVAPEEPRSVGAPPKKPGGATPEAAPPAEEDERAAVAPEPTTPEQTPAPEPSNLASPDVSQGLVGKRSYVVRPGDCLWHIAAALLPVNASTIEIEEKVQSLWRLNEDRIGTGDPDLLLVGTELMLG